MSPRSEIWFPAKRYGWGWGLPCRWQGWVVLLAYAGLLVVGVRWLEPNSSPWPYLAYTLALTAVLVWICWRKGERPRWRWGGD